MAEFLFMIHLVNLPPSAHTITFSAHCSKFPVHTHCSNHYIFSAHCSYIIQCTLQQIFSAHCSYTIQCTLQEISSAHCSKSSVHTAAILSSSHCSYTIQCKLQLHYLVSILYSTFSAPLNHHRVSLYHYWPTSRTVSRY